MKLRDGQWIVEPPLPDARAIGSAGSDFVPAQPPAAVDTVWPASLEQLEPTQA